MVVDQLQSFNLGTVVGRVNCYSVVASNDYWNVLTVYVEFEGFSACHSIFHPPGEAFLLFGKPVFVSIRSDIARVGNCAFSLV